MNRTQSSNGGKQPVKPVPHSNTNSNSNGRPSGSEALINANMIWTKFMSIMITIVTVIHI